MARADQLVRGDQAAPAGRLGCAMGEHYFTAVPSAPSRPVAVELRLPDLDLDLLADRGVFSAGRVDPGTLALLRESPPPPVSGELLDLGCGYGPIACVLGRRSPAARVWAVDVNRRALELTSANAEFKRRGQRQRGPPGRGTGPHCLQRNLVQSPRYVSARPHCTICCRPG